MNESRNDIVDFCPRCFADTRGGSWGHTANDWGCTNCGSPSTVAVPAWVVDSVRENASWVGKRYYPCQEDKDDQRELEYLRSLQKREDLQVEQHEYEGEVFYMVSNGVQTLGSFRDAEAALALGRGQLRIIVPERGQDA